MYKIIDERATGKTMRLILLAKQYNATIVSNCPKSVIMKCKELDFNEPVKVISYADFLTIRNDKDKNRYLIDDISGFLHKLHPNVIGYTDSFENYLDNELVNFRKE